MVSREYVEEYIKRHPGVTVMDIVDSLDVEPWKRESVRSCIHTKCESLKKFGVVESYKEGRITHWKVISDD